MSAAPTLTNALDAQRFDFIAEVAEALGHLATSALMAADDCDRLRSVVYLTLASRTLANALRVAAELGKAEASA